MDQNCAPVVTTPSYLWGSVGIVRLKCGAISFQFSPAVDRVLTLGSLPNEGRLSNGKGRPKSKVLNSSLSSGVGAYSRVMNAVKS